MLDQATTMRKRLVLLLTLAAFASPACHVAPPPASAEPPPASVQRPDHVLDVLGVREGLTVADVDCGAGSFLVQLSKRVGPRGRVWATVLTPERLAVLRKDLEAKGITNVVPILATPDDTKLPHRTFDLVLLVDAYHELTKPSVVLSQISASLAPGGRLALVEDRGEDPNASLAQLQKELEVSGWSFLESDESLTRRRIVTFVPR